MPTERCCLCPPHARIMPLDRGERYEVPLQQALDGNDLSAVTGTMPAEIGEIKSGSHADRYRARRFPQIFRIGPDLVPAFRHFWQWGR
jgi:hypothetical protein